METKSLSEEVIKYVLTISEEEFASVSVENLARAFKTDRFKLSREFKQQTQMKLEEFLFREKMNRAALMLLGYRSITVKEVSERIGFCTCDYFIRVFRQFYGVVPGRFKDYKTLRSGQDRRSAKSERRQPGLKYKISESEDRRSGKKDRRKGETDRRSQNHNHDQEMKDNEQALRLEHLQNIVQEKEEEHISKECKDCYFRKFAMNFDDWK